MSWTRGEHRLGSSVPFPGDLFAPNRAAGVNVIAGRVDSAMFFAVCNFVGLHWAALGAARVADQRGCQQQWRRHLGRERPPPPLPEPGPGLQFEGVAHAPDACRCRPAEPRFVRDTFECAAGVLCHKRMAHER